MKHYVRLEAGVYIADGIGDPCRTLKIENAKRFRTQFLAKEAIIEARKHRPFKDACILTECLYMTGIKYRETYIPCKIKGTEILDETHGMDEKND